MKLLLTLLFILFAKISFAFNITEKPINVIMPFGAGGGVDQTFRHFEKYLSNQNIKMIPVYKPGANGVVAGSELFSSVPDGTIIYIGTAATLAEFESKNPGKKLTSVSLIRNSIMSVVSGKLKNFEELETSIKNNQRILLGYTSPDQIRLFNEFASRINKNYTPELVPYKAVPQMLQDLGGGVIDLSLVPFSVSKPLIDSKKLTLIAHDNNVEIEGFNATALPKQFKNWTRFGGFALALPPNASPDIVQVYLKLLTAYVNDPNTLKDWRQDLLIPVPLGRQALDEQIKLAQEK